MTKTDQIIEFVKQSGNGRTFGEIQRFIVELNGLNYDEFEDTWCGRRRKYRGYYCTNLIGAGRGILRKNGCKNVDGRWVFQA